MPDGELRVYTLKFSSFTAYFTDDGDGGSRLVVEKAADSMLPDSLIPQVREAVLQAVATQLHCPPDAVEMRDTRLLCERLVTPREQPRHPWQVERSRTRPSFKRSPR